MKKKLSEKRFDFVWTIMETLNTDQVFNGSASKALKEICEFFSMDFGFVYQAEHTDVFCLYEAYDVRPHVIMPPSVDFLSFSGERFMERMSGVRYLIMKAESFLDSRYRKLLELFQSNFMLLVPVLGEDQKVIALLGAGTRGCNTKHHVFDLQLAQSALTVLANHVKLRIYQKRAENTKHSLENIINNMNVDIYVNDFYTHEILYANDSMAKPYGGMENMIGKLCWQVLYQDKKEPCDYCPRLKLIDDWGNPANVYTWDYQRPFDGAWFRVLSSAFHWVDGRLAHIVSSVDISDNKRNEELIRQMAEYDSLTGLPNRRKLLMDGEECLDDLRKAGGNGYLMFFDLDGFKMVNDRYGHSAGDELLIKIGQFLEGNEFTKNKCYRYGGDEFVIFCFNRDICFVKKVIEILLERFARLWILKNEIVFVKSSVGVSHFPGDAASAAELIHCADMAMYSAKREGGEKVMFFNRGRFCGVEDYR